ncbi:MAG TPA: TIGR00269 family protein [Nitrososphaera sp.]|nr:TIGR00269 family protein [Nitrososphaera sp.]
MDRLCTKCQKEAIVIKRDYSGESLCKKCFLRSIEEKVARTISKYSMVRYRDRVAVGVSGGKDSLSLLVILDRLFKKRDNGNELVAVTIDEGITGYREESLQIVKQVCEELGVESQVLSYKTLFGTTMDEAMVTRPSEKMTSCSMCGTFRRRAIDIAAEQAGATVVATAHNLDDHIQTFMINVLAGDSDRIGWTHPASTSYGKGLRKIKPLVEIPEYEVAFYALQRGLPFQSEECPYMAESIRTEIRAFFNALEREHPGIKHNAFSSILKISEGIQSRPEKAKCEVCGRDSAGAVCSACKTVHLLQGSSNNTQI